MMFPTTEWIIKQIVPAIPGVFQVWRYNPVTETKAPLRVPVELWALVERRNSGDVAVVGLSALDIQCSEDIDQLLNGTDIVGFERDNAAGEATR